MNRLEEKIKIFKNHNIKNDILLGDIIRLELSKYLQQLVSNTIKYLIEERIKYLIDLFTEINVEIDVNFEIDGSVFKIDISVPSIVNEKIFYFDIINEERRKKLEKINKKI